MKRIRAWVLRSLAAALVSVWTSQAAVPSSDAATTQPAGPPPTTGAAVVSQDCVRVRLQTNETERVSVWVDEVLVTTLSRLEAAGGSIKTNCVTLQLTGDRSSILVGADCRPVCLSGWGLDGWEAQIPVGLHLAVLPDFARGLLDVAASSGNAGSVTMTFIDGAVVQLPPGTGGRLDVLGDRTYVFSAWGKASGRDGEGREVALSAHSLPLTGGPWVETRGEDGQLIRTRLSPTTDVRLAGSVGGEVTIRVGDQTVTLERAGNRTVTMPNGAAITFRQDPAARAVSWQVAKGDFRVSVEGIAGWQAVGLTGLSAAMAWNVDSQSVAVAMDLTNTSSRVPANTMLVALPAQVTARVAPGATFQYMGSRGSTDFQTSSLGGSVVLVNLSTGQGVDLEAGNMAFTGGRPLIRGGTLQVGQPVTLVWGANAAVQLNGLLGDVAIPPGGSRQVRSASGGLLRVSNEPGVGVILQAISGDFSFDVRGARSGTITVPEGTTVTMGYNASAGIFTTTTTEGRARVVTGSGAARELPAGMMMTVVNGRVTTASARPEHDIVFFQNLRNRRVDGASSTTGTEATLEGAGAGGDDGFTTTLFGGANQLDTSRIPQPPASITGLP